MQQINQPRPDICFYKDGLIELFASGYIKLRLLEATPLSFFIDNENNLYIYKDNEDGIVPSSFVGRFTRYKSATVTRQVFTLPDIPSGFIKVSFRIGEEENGMFPVITRKIIK